MKKGLVLVAGVGVGGKDDDLPDIYCTLTPATCQDEMSGIPEICATHFKILADMSGMFLNY